MHLVCGTLLYRTTTTSDWSFNKYFLTTFYELEVVPASSFTILSYKDDSGALWRKSNQTEHLWTVQSVVGAQTRGFS